MQFGLKRLFVGVTVIAVLSGVARLISAVALNAMFAGMASTAILFAVMRWALPAYETRRGSRPAIDALFAFFAFVFSTAVSVVSVIVLLSEAYKAIVGD